MRVKFPHVLLVDTLAANNPIRQIGLPSAIHTGEVITLAVGRARHQILRIADGGSDVGFVSKGKQAPDGLQAVVQAELSDSPEQDHSGATWRQHPLLNARDSSLLPSAAALERVLESWKGAFNYGRDDPAAGVIGLRPPQLGAVHAVHGHWAASSAPATIVMPTGTGKTETMLSILVSAGCPKLLVVVPTDVLRSQLTEKFLTLGILKAPGSTLLSAAAQFPVVCMLQHIPTDPAEVDCIFSAANVIVTTGSIAGQCSSDVRARMAHHCPYLFVDEAHHVAAPTWNAFKQAFADRLVLQFTATPFREDGRPLDGIIVFNYTLKQAQLDGYFKPIAFRPIVEFNIARSDAAIARVAVEQLRTDADRGHILMARVDSISRANDVFALYEPYVEFKPVQLHTGIKSKRERDRARSQIISGASRIVVCVDMLGEGFDLPELKIAAFHDIRKSLAVTLQLAGRFTRSRQGLGNATFIANTADVNVQDELRKLYTREPDWNVLLPELSEALVGQQVSLQNFLKEFTAFTGEIPLKTVRPAVSTVVYKTSCQQWMPEQFRDGIPGIDACEQVHYSVSVRHHTLVVITARRVLLDWTDVESIYSWDWELYVVIWSPEQKLLFINSSTNSGVYRSLANAVAGEAVSLIQGQQVFRSFAHISRLQLQSVGLTEQLGRNVRYTGRMGADVGPALSDLQRSRVRKTVLSGTGYENGVRTTVGASRKGRIWSHRREHVDQLSDWCKSLGAKLLDESINPDEVLKGTLESQTVTHRPVKIPIAVDWPEEFYVTPEAQWAFIVDGVEYPLSDMSLEVSSFTPTGPLRAVLRAPHAVVEIDLEFFDDVGVPNYRFQTAREVGIRRGSRSYAHTLSEFFYDSPPVIWFADGSALEGNQYVELKRQAPSYNADRIMVWDWTGIDIRRESQGAEKMQGTIQWKVIKELSGGAYQLIVDDDGSGEAADVVAVRVLGTIAAPTGLYVEFYHCKYSQDALPGARVGDLYEVCGQAQKSVHWMSSPEKRTDLFTHLLRREAKRAESGATRCEVGDSELLQTIREMSRLVPVALKVIIVQPGVSKVGVSQEQLELMSVTDNYLRETFQLEFAVIASS